MFFLQAMVEIVTVYFTRQGRLVGCLLPANAEFDGGACGASKGLPILREAQMDTCFSGNPPLGF